MREAHLGRAGRQPGALGRRRALHSIVLSLGVALLLALPTGARADTPPPPDLLRPVEGGLVHPFVAPAQRWSAGHRGADLAGDVGTAVLAGEDGMVAYVGRVVDREVVSIDHGNGWRTTYEPVHAIVARGAVVRAGDPIGYLEAGDECPGPCLHWGLRLGRDYVDPMAHLAADGVRLLPAGSRPQTRSVPGAPRSLLPLLREPLPAASGALARPSPAPITSPFGMRFHPVLHVWKLHDGTDFGAPCGAPARVAANGRVVLTERNIAYGNRVIVDHGVVNGHHLRTSYNHLSAIGVSPGQVLHQGDLVGSVGTTGFSTGCHLHFMVWRDGVVVNPMGELS